MLLAISDSSSPVIVSLRSFGLLLMRTWKLFMKTISFKRIQIVLWIRKCASLLGSGAETGVMSLLLFFENRSSYILEKRSFIPLNMRAGWKISLMEHIYPTFKKGKILTREMLTALRDLAWLKEQIAYLDYPKGIIYGCKLRVENQHISIGPGQIKCRDYVFLLGELRPLLLKGIKE